MRNDVEMNLKFWKICALLKNYWLDARGSVVDGEGRPVLFLRGSLVLTALNTAIFHFFPITSHDTRGNLLLCGVLLVLAWLAGRPSWFVYVLYAALAGCAALNLFISANMGGIHSTVLLWVCLLPLPALLSAGILHGLVWFLLAEVMLLFMWAFTGTLLSAAVPQGVYETWILAGNLALCVLLPFAVVFLYDHLNRCRVRALEDGNLALQETQSALLQAQAHRDEFVAAVGHELRTPMSAILGLNVVLRDQLLQVPDQLEAVDHIRQSTQQLLGVVNNILDFSQLQAGQLRLYPDWSDLRAAAAQVIDEHHGRAHLKSVALQLELAADLPSQLHLDHMRFKQVLSNLLDNAVRQSPDSGQVRVSVALKGEHLHVEVHDDGPGIDFEQQEHIFSLFMQEEQSNRRNNEGTGLGLSICHQILGLQGGHIGVISKKGAGACFWFDWPLPTPELKPAQAPASKLLQALDVLVVDDDAVNRMVTTLQLRKALPQCRVVAVADATQAQQHLKAEPCDVVVLDMYMPGVSGLDLARWVRRQPGPLQVITLIGLTASTYPQDWDLCMEAGMNGVLTKPLEMTRIIQMLMRFQFLERGQTK